MLEIFFDWIIRTPYKWSYKLDELKVGDKIMVNFGNSPARAIVKAVRSKAILLCLIYETDWTSFDSYRFDYWKE